jgi:hypothetical protein
MWKCGVDLVYDKYLPPKLILMQCNATTKKRLSCGKVKKTQQNIKYCDILLATPDMIPTRSDHNFNIGHINEYVFLDGF